MARMSEGADTTDHYRTLQVTRDADPEVIDRAYRVLSRKYHPDLAHPDDRTAATARMQRLNEAYRVLGDARLRREYDKTLPPERMRGWDVFLERGLVGLFLERYSASKRGPRAR